MFSQCNYFSLVPHAMNPALQRQTKGVGGGLIPLVKRRRIISDFDGGAVGREFQQPQPTVSPPGFHLKIYQHLMNLLTAVGGRSQLSQPIVEDMAIEGHNKVVAPTDQLTPQLFTVVHIVFSSLGNAIAVRNS